MGTVILSATAVLVVMGFSDNILWLAAVALLYLYVRHGRTGGGSAPSGPPAAGGSAQTWRAVSTTGKAGRLGSMIWMHTPCRDHSKMSPSQVWRPSGRRSRRRPSARPRSSRASR